MQTNVALYNDSLNAEPLQMSHRYSNYASYRAPINQRSQYEIPHSVNTISSPLVNTGSTSGINEYTRNTNVANQYQMYRDCRRKLMDLPEFDGKPEKWPIFIASYRESTLAYEYSDLENNFRLQKCLKGDAKSSVESLLIYPRNTSEVISQLEFLYGRSECLLRSQIANIRRINAIDDNNLQQMIPFAIKVRNLVTFIETTNSMQHLANPLLLDELVCKLPMSKRLDWVNFSANIKPYASIADFSEWVNQMAKLISKVPIQSSVTGNLRNSTLSTKRSSVLHANEDTTKIKKELCCQLCKAKHLLPECAMFQNKNVKERWEFIKSKRLCFSCMKFGHTTFQCRKNAICNKNECKKRHHPLLHDDDMDATVNQLTVSNKNGNQAATSNPAPVLSCRTQDALPNSKMSKSQMVLFKIVPVKIFGNGKVIETSALLDDGSSVSLIDESLVQELQLREENCDDLNLRWFGDITSTHASKSYTIEICGYAKNCKMHRLTNVRSIKNLQLPSQTLNLDEICSSSNRLKNLPIVNYTNAKPQILIGLDNCHIGVSKNMSFESQQPIVINTKLGWIVYGKTNIETSAVESSPLFLTSEMDNNLHDLINDYFTTENFGVSQVENIVESKDDKRAIAILQSTTVKKNQYYETGLLWESDDIVLPESLPMALQTFYTLENKMKKDPEYASAYSDIINTYLAKGYARKLTALEARTQTPRTWYLPHFAVRNLSKPKKLRLVFDAAASINGVSLNSKLLTGPDQYQSLVTILFKFREGKIAVCGDIKQMFHQVKIRREDQDAQRFIWRSNQNEPICFYVMEAMTFGAKCSPCSAQFVKNENAKRFIIEHPKAVDAILYNHYVDDYVKSFKDEEDALNVTKAVISIHKDGGFELCNFVSNSNYVLKSLNQDDAQPLMLNMDKNNIVDKILGMYWDTKTDEFKFELKFHRVDPAVLSKNRKLTKRELLRYMMSIFDPFGFLSNFTIACKIMIQDVWKSGIEWDDYISDDIYQRWLCWEKELQKVKNFHIARCYTPLLQQDAEVQLHIFVDASESAFCAVAYFRVECKGEVNVVFVASKTKCAPKKILSIPRLELQAAVLGVRLKNSIMESHDVNIKEYMFWTDSYILIQWIKSNHRKYKPFVCFRISEILEHTTELNWRWISTHLNVADDATREKNPPKFNVEGRWKNGPEFLVKSPTDWPLNKRLIQDECTEELLSKHQYVMQIVNDEMLLNLNSFSKYTSVIRVIAWVKRFVYNSQNKLNKTRGELQVRELDEAEIYVCKVVQMNSFAEDYATLENQAKRSSNEGVGRNSSLFELTPQLGEDGVIRLNGRINNAFAIPESTRKPIILPKMHVLTRLIVTHFHNKLHHLNQETVICEIRRKFWIPHIRTVVKNVKRNCQYCKIKAAKPIVPLMGQLPIDRLTPYVRPFTYTGLDFFGPFIVTNGRRREKRWVALFTCLTVRAIHLEVAHDLSTDACMICLRNFINRRGVPIRIRSDNGTNFIGASKELQSTNNFIDHNFIQSAMAVRGIEWLFNCPSNPNAGGCWERMVQSVKRVLNNILKEVAPRIDTLTSLLIEAENIVNSRPLTHIPVCSAEDEPLTPNHFLLGTMNSTQTPGSDDIALFRLKKQWRISQQLKNQFWKRWIAEYLPILTRRSKWYERTQPIQVGDLVIICDSAVPRSQWYRGRIIRVFPAKDGQVRSADVKTANGVLKRPVSKLAVLDVGSKSVIYGGLDVAERDCIKVNENSNTPDPMTNLERNRKKEERIKAAVKCV